MVKNFNLARPYVKAIFTLALQHDKLTEWENLLHLLSWLISQDATVDILQNPNITHSKKLEFLNSICNITEEPMQTEASNFLELLLSKKKLLILPQIEISFKDYKSNYEKVMTGNVMSAFALNKEQLRKIEIFLEEKFKNKIVLDNTIDSELIGGAVIQIKDYIIDMSVKGQLKRLSEFLI